jgi:NAD-dependent dihydropyrimidine dehydrogenase PreA subunit
MPGLFIDVVVDSKVASDPELAKKLEEVCPVSIFAAGDSGVTVVEDNLDECTLCDLCLNAAPDGSIKIQKLYEQA